MQNPISTQIKPGAIIYNYPVFARQTNGVTVSSLQLPVTLNQNYQTINDATFVVPSSAKEYDAATICLRMRCGVLLTLTNAAVYYFSLKNAFVGTEPNYGTAGLHVDAINQNNIFIGDYDEHYLNTIPSSLDFNSLTARAEFDLGWAYASFPPDVSAVQRLIYYFHMVVIVHKWRS